MLTGSRPCRVQGKIICIGLNYRDHAAESRMPIPEKPVVFSKFSTAVIAPGEPGGPAVDESTSGLRSRSWRS
jgi:2-keto-4-pentenoate hydratase/2-oxohepta-3-ene-1,7-dioic acid hydratase in catechol pathway